MITEHGKRRFFNRRERRQIRTSGIARKRPRFWLDTQNHFKIWFSKDPNVALGLENELRLIRTRAQNPEIKINLIYSSSSLNDDAIRHLKEFCLKHTINLVDFDKDIKSTITDENDREIYQIARKEILKTQLNEGGNLGAASDCTRTLLPVLQKYGIYSDLDVDVNMAGFQKYLKVKSPIILATDTITIGGLKDFVINNDTFAVASDIKNKNSIASQAISAIRAIQRKIIDNYKSNPLSVIYSPYINGLPLSLSQTPNCGHIIDDYFRNHPEADIFAFRKYLSNFTLKSLFKALPSTTRYDLFTIINDDNHTEEQLKELYTNSGKIAGAKIPENEIVPMLKQITYKQTVVQFSGPLVAVNAFESVKPKKLEIKIKNYTPVILPKLAWERFLKITKRASLGANGLNKAFYSPNSAEIFLKKNLGNNLMEQIGTAGDQAWSELGDIKKKEREAKIEKAVISLQTSIRAKLATDALKTLAATKSPTEKKKKAILTQYQDTKLNQARKSSKNSAALPRARSTRHQQHKFI